jgi:hypothetical protein
MGDRDQRRTVIGIGENPQADHADDGLVVGGDDRLSVRCSEAADVGGGDAECGRYARGMDADVSIRWIRESDGEGAEWGDDSDCGGCGDEPADGIGL